MSFLKKLGSRMRFPLLALPAVAVTVFSLIALLSVTVQVAVASQPGDLLYPLRQPALQIRGALTFGADIRSGINLPIIADKSGSLGFRRVLRADEPSAFRIWG